MKVLSILLILLISSTGISQDYNFKPLWKKGEVKEVKISQVEKEYEDGQLISKDTFENEARIEVLDIDGDHYTLEILMENQALSSAMEFYKKIGKELNDYTDLKLIYSVHKETSEAELMNWEEAQKFMLDSFEQISSVLDKKAPDTAPFIGLIFSPLEEIFSSKENIEAYMEDNIGYILTPFNKDFKLGETITKTESGENPFNPSQDISATKMLTLVSVDEDSKTCEIHQEIELDLSEFIQMMKEMMLSMSESFGADESVTAEKSKEMDDFEMDIENLQVITFDYESTWVTSVVSTGTVSGTDPKKGIKSKKEVITTAIIN